MVVGLEVQSFAAFFLFCSFQDGAHEIIQQDYVRHDGFCCVLSSVCPLYSSLSQAAWCDSHEATLHIVWYCMSSSLKWFLGFINVCVSLCEHMHV